MKDKPCQGFAWIGQSIQHCDDCGFPAWEHDGMQRLRGGMGPFDSSKDAWEIKPWGDGVIAAWLKNGLIDRQRAIALLAYQGEDDVQATG